VWTRAFGKEHASLYDRIKVCNQLKGTLQMLGVEQMVVGHTPQVNMSPHHHPVNLCGGGGQETVTSYEACAFVTLPPARQAEGVGAGGGGGGGLLI